MKITCYCDLYVSERLNKKKNQVIRKLMQQKALPSVYIITLAQGEQNQLEFFSALLLKQHIFQHTDLFVVGIADGYDSAIELVEQITRDIVKQTGGTDLRKQITDRQKKFIESRA